MFTRAMRWMYRAYAWLVLVAVIVQFLLAITATRVRIRAGAAANRSLCDIMQGVPALLPGPLALVADEAQKVCVVYDTCCQSPRRGDHRVALPVLVVLAVLAVLA